jgi:hypothetical protein
LYRAFLLRCLIDAARTRSRRWAGAELAFRRGSVANGHIGER